MPSDRLYTIRGKVPSALTHTKIQLSSYDPKHMYVIEKFTVMPAGSPTKADAYGCVSMGKNDNIDPSDADFSNQNEIAWAHTGVWQSGTALPNSEGVVISTQEINDEKLFNYDIWLHTKEVLGAEEMNYFIKIRRYDTGAVQGSIGSLRQYQYNDQENQ